MEKTIKEWLETLPEPYRTEALENADKRDLKYPQPSLAEAISASSVWVDTTQGHDYWEDICIRAEAGEFNKNSLDKDSEK